MNITSFLKRLAQRLGSVQTPMSEGDYRIARIERETFVYEESGRKAYVVGTMLIGAERPYAFDFADAIWHWETPHGIEPITQEEKRVIFDRLEKYMSDHGWSFFLDE